MDLERYIDSKELFAGHYRLIMLLSEEGGTADVWLAENDESVDTTFSEEKDDVIRLEGTGVLVAIKIYRPKNALDVEGEQSFRQEFKTIFNCHHANLIPTTDYSICDGMPYLVMPFCKNGSVESLVGKLTSSDDIWKFIYDAASGLEYLHSCNPPIIHQDIKPANILIDANKNFCITDFGISVKSGVIDDQFLDNESCGTTIYMPPERFENNYTADTSSDIWSLGATIYELIHGDVPFGDEGGKAQKTNTRVPSLGSQIPKDIRKLVYACLSFEPQSRPTAYQIAEIARNKGKKPFKKLLWGGAIVLISTICILSWTLTRPSDEVVDPFLIHYNSADSILSIQKQEVKANDNLNYESTNNRLSKAKKKYQTALEHDYKDKNKRDSATVAIRKIEDIAPILNEYKGTLDTLKILEEDEVPIQIERYKEKTRIISDKIKQKILNI